MQAHSLELSRFAVELETVFTTDVDNSDTETLPLLIDDQPSLPTPVALPKYINKVIRATTV